MIWLLTEQQRKDTVMKHYDLNSKHLHTYQFLTNPFTKSDFRMMPLELLPQNVLLTVTDMTFYNLVTQVSLEYQWHHKVA